MGSRVAVSRLFPVRKVGGVDVAFVERAAGVAAGAADGEALSIAPDGSGAVGSTTFAVTAGPLPPGLSLSPGGALTGAATTLGTSSFTVTATDQHGVTGSRGYTLAVVPQLTVTPASIDFGGVAVTDSATLGPITVTNRGTVAVVLSSRSTNNPSEFAAVNDTCFTLDPLEPGESCTSDARFAPVDEGPSTGSLTWNFTRQGTATAVSAGIALSGGASERSCGPVRGSTTNAEVGAVHDPGLHLGRHLVRGTTAGLED